MNLSDIVCFVVSSSSLKRSGEISTPGQNILTGTVAVTKRRPQQKQINWRPMPARIPLSVSEQDNPIGKIQFGQPNPIRAVLDREAGGRKTLAVGGRTNRGR